MTKQSKIFETDNVDLAAFLAMNDFVYLGCKTELDPETERPRGVLQFEDPKEVGIDLERVFLNSEFKKYRDQNKYFLREVHKSMKKVYIGGQDEKKNSIR